MAELLSIGRFARLTGLSVGALRHYDEVGLLRPARTDPDTGYRFYREDQLPQARAIQRLRALDLSLDEIRDVLADGDIGRSGSTHDACRRGSGACSACSTG